MGPMDHNMGVGRGLKLGEQKQTATSNKVFMINFDFQKIAMSSTVPVFDEPSIGVL